MIFLFALAIAGCAKSDGDQLVGQWYKSDGSAEIQLVDPASLRRLLSCVGAGRVAGIRLLQR